MLKYETSSYMKLKHRYLNDLSLLSFHKLKKDNTQIGRNIVFFFIIIVDLTFVAKLVRRKGKQICVKEYLKLQFKEFFFTNKNFTKALYQCSYFLHLQMRMIFFFLVFEI